MQSFKLVYSTFSQLSSPVDHSSCIDDMQTCTVGAKVWGAVSDVLPHGLMVSLPDGLKGYVKAQEVCQTCMMLR